MIHIHVGSMLKVRKDEIDRSFKTTHGISYVQTRISEPVEYKQKTLNNMIDDFYSKAG
jgi:hypothetical protein